LGRELQEKVRREKEQRKERKKKKKKSPNFAIPDWNQRTVGTRRHTGSWSLVEGVRGGEKEKGKKRCRKENRITKKVIKSPSKNDEGTSLKKKHIRVRQGLSEGREDEKGVGGGKTEKIAD